MAAAWSRSVAGPTIPRILFHQGGHLPYHRACLSKTAPRAKQFFSSKKTWDVFHGVLFGLLLLLTAVSPVRIHLARAISTDGKHLCHRAPPALGPGSNAGFRLNDNLSVSLHDNLLGYYAIYSSVLRLRRAQVPEQITVPADRSSVTPFRRMAGLLFTLLLLSGDVQPNPGPVTGALQNFCADLCPSVTGTPSVPVVSKH